MKKYITVLLLLLCLQVTGTTYYVSSSGNNTNSGTQTSPWKTLAYAGTKATKLLDVIHVLPGSYIESQTCILSPGVSIEGDGESSRIKYTSVNIAILIDYGITGQHISNILIDADNSSDISAVVVDHSEEVYVDRCKFINFKTGASHFARESYSYIIEIRNSDYCEIHHNSIEGGIRAFDFYSLSIYNNILTRKTLALDPETGMYFAGIQELKVYNNSFKYFGYQIELVAWGVRPVENVYIYNNIMTDIGVSSGDRYGSGISMQGLTTVPCRNLNVVNNTLVANPGDRSTMIGVWLPTLSENGVTSILVVNNIIQGFKYASIYAAGPDSRMDSLYIQNNILYGNAIEGVKVDSATNFPYFTNVSLPRIYVESDLIIEKPIFVSSTDFHLAENSTGIDQGMTIDWIATDFYGAEITGPFNIGACWDDVLPTGIEDPILSNKFVIYPNPATDRINFICKDLDFEPTKLEIFTIIGKIVFSQNITNEFSNGDVYSLSVNYKPGLYLARLSNTKGKSLTSKLIIK